MIDKEFYRKRYHAQKSMAGKRGIEWHFTFDSWFDWWGEDIINRGCRKGQLVMARKGDIGHYHHDNVFKTTCSENLRDGNVGKIVSEETKNKFRVWRKTQITSDETKTKMSISQLKRREMEKQ
jgi:hypothetical protein